MYDKRQFHKATDKKVLHKVRKQWITISIALLALIGGSVLADRINVSANSNNGDSNTQTQSNHVNNLHNRLVTSTHTTVQDTNSSSNSAQNIERKVNQVHRNILKHAMTNTHTINTDLPNNSDTPQKTISYRTTINGKPAKKVNNINRLRIHHRADYKGFVFSRINTPFKHLAVQHAVHLYNQIFLNGNRSKYNIKHSTTRILKAYKQYGHMGVYTRYLIHIHHGNYYINGDNKFVSFVAPSKHYQYYQRKIDKILNGAHNHKFNRVRRTLRKLNHKHITNYKRYMNLYINAYNLQQDIHHPMVVNYHHKYVHYKYNHTHDNEGKSTKLVKPLKNDNPINSLSPTTSNNTSNNASDLVKFLNTPTNNVSSNNANDFSLSSSFNIPNVPAPIVPVIPSNNEPSSSSSSIHNIVPNTPTPNSDNKSNHDSSSNSISDIASASNAVQSASSVLSLASNRVNVTNSIFNSVKSQDSSGVNSYDSASQNYKSASKMYNTASKAFNNASIANNSLAKDNAQNSENIARNSENSYSIIMNDTSSVYNSYALASVNDSNAISVLNSAYGVYYSADHIESSIINKHSHNGDRSQSKSNNSNSNSNPVRPGSNDSNKNSYYASSAAKSADESIANSYKNSVSASVSIVNQSKAESAASSADRSIDDSIANSYAKSTENTSSYKNSVSVSNSRTVSLAAKLADRSLDDFIAGSYAKSADDSMANSYRASVSNSVSLADQSVASSAAKSADDSIADSVSASVSNSVSALDQSIANSAKNSADSSIANSMSPASASQSSVISQFTNETLYDINQVRQTHNLNKVQLNSSLENVAKLRANQLTTDFSYFNDNHQYYFKSDVNTLGYRDLANATYYGEVIGKSPVNVNLTVKSGNNSKNYKIYDGNSMADMNVNTHYDEFFDKDMTNVGISAAYNPNDKNYYLVIDLASKIPKIPSDERYLIADNSGKSVRLNNIDSDGTYSGDTYSTGYGLVHVINRKNVLGYHFDEVDYHQKNNNRRFWVFSDELSTDPSAKFASLHEWNNFVNTFNSNSEKDYTPSDRSKIKSIRQRYTYLLKYENSNDTRAMNVYRHHIVDWVNFYRSLHGISPVSEDSDSSTRNSSKPSFDNIAQENAEKQSDPECMIPGNLNGSAIYPSMVDGYYTDTNDLDNSNTHVNKHIPGHRISILNPRADKIGVGEQGAVNTLYFDHGVNNSIINDNREYVYPNSGVYPINYAAQGGSNYWGYSFINYNNVDWNSSPTSYSGVIVQNPHVSVYDDTDNKDIAVYNVHNDPNVAGSVVMPYSGAIYYKVDTSALRANHKYTITISGQGIPNGSYKYSTRLFEL